MATAELRKMQCVQIMVFIVRTTIKDSLNLHIHILLTLRPLNEDGTWGAKSRKEYVLDADGNRIPNALSLIHI